MILHQSSGHNWICPRCNKELGELNGWCEYCKHYDDITVYNPDPYIIRVNRDRHIEEAIVSEEKPKTQEDFDAEIDANQRMTPQEKLYAKLFYHETMYVKDLDDLALRAHREKLSKIVFEGKVCYAATDAEEKRRDKLAKNNGKPTGFKRSINSDEASTEAINIVRERQKRMTKAEKVRASLISMGVSEADADKMMSAGTIMSKLNEKDEKAKEALTGKTIKSPFSQENGFVMKAPEVKEPEKIKPSEPEKPFFNPFAKK